MKGIINFSKKKFPTYKETRNIKGSYKDHTDYYFIYDLSKSEIGNYLNTWFPGVNIRNKKELIYNEVLTVKKTNKRTSANLYHRNYNPILILMNPATEYKNKSYEKLKDLYNMKAQICSIDDSSYGVWWNKRTLKELKDTRIKLMKQINTYDEVDGDEFLKYCVSIGADKDTIDYN